MIFDFSGCPLRDCGYSQRPMTILDPEAKAVLSAIMEIALLETNSRTVCDEWQQVQLRNLTRHAVERSPFWRARANNRRNGDIELASLPILTRQDLCRQVASEGALLHPSDRIPTKVHETSGSSSAPVQFFISEFNIRYNAIRSTAQYFLEGRDLSLNRTRIVQSHEPIKDGIQVKTDPSWFGPIASLISSGTNKHIRYGMGETSDVGQLLSELTKDDIGYLVTSPRLLEALSSSFELDFLREAKTALWISLSEKIDPHLTDAFSRLSIPIRQSYSCEEVGPIAHECAVFPGHYHVVTSNVMVEVVDADYELEGHKLGRILVTHLHSYATPFIRYDVGDLGCLRDQCPCGHDGPAIFNLHGRASNVIKHHDGRLSPFMIFGKSLRKLAEFSEFRIRQTAFDRIVVEIGGRSALTPDEVAVIERFFKDRAGPEFDIEVKATQQIDWGKSRKRPSFVCEI
jgi:phenylacetate-coenzyme A ligase PaaK-like adenylate-forming protein